jgi:hypothetical protein
MPIEWDNIKTWVKDTTKIALKEAEDLTYKGKIKMQIFSLTHEKERLIIRLGELIYSDYKKNQITILNEKAMEIIDKIKKTDDKIKEKKEELKKEQ